MRTGIVKILDVDMPIATVSGAQWVPFRYVCDLLQVNYNAQLRKKDRFDKHVEVRNLPIPGPDGKVHWYLCIQWESIAPWAESLRWPGTKSRAATRLELLKEQLEKVELIRTADVRTNERFMLDG